MKVLAPCLNMDLSFYHVMLLHENEQGNIFSFMPLIVPIWSATVTLEQHIIIEETMLLLMNQVWRFLQAI